MTSPQAVEAPWLGTDVPASECSAASAPADAYQREYEALMAWAGKHLCRVCSSALEYVPAYDWWYCFSCRPKHGSYNP